MGEIYKQNHNLNKAFSVLDVCKCRCMCLGGEDVDRKRLDQCDDCVCISYTLPSLALLCISSLAPES